MSNLPPRFSFAYLEPSAESWVRGNPFDRSPANRIRTAAVIHALRQAGGRPGDSVLEIGCGVGNLARALAAASYVVKGIEPHAESFREAQSRGTSSHLEFENKMSFAEDLGRYRFLILSEVLEHVPDDMGLLADISRRMADSAGLILTIPNGAGVAERLLRPVYFIKRWRAGVQLIQGLKVLLGARDLTTADTQTPHLHFYRFANVVDIFARLFRVNGYYAFYRHWVLWEILLGPKRLPEQMARRDFYCSQSLSADRCAQWVFMLSKRQSHLLQNRR